MEKHYIALLNNLGDTRVEFDADNPVSLADAKAVWDDVKRKGGEFFRAAPAGEGGERLRDFDPHADMVAVPKIVGG